MSEQAEFLRALWPDGLPDRARLLIWTLQDKRSRWYSDLDSAIAAAEALPRDQDCYVGCGLTETVKGPGERAVANEIMALPGFWADLDLAAAGDRKRRFPDMATATAVAATMTGTPPSLAVASGHGLQAWWLFKEPLEFRTPAEHAVAMAQLRAFGVALTAGALRAGYDLDAVWDLARIMRLPGTVNCKVPGQHVPVRLLSQ